MRTEGITARLQQVPLARYLDAKIVRAAESDMLASLPFAERLVGNPRLKLFHGGVVATFMEIMATVAVWQDADKPMPKPINLTVDYLRPALPELLHTSVTVTQSGNRVARVEALCWQSDRDKPVCKGLFHFLLV